MTIPCVGGVSPAQPLLFIFQKKLGFSGRALFYGKYATGEKKIKAGFKHVCDFMMEGDVSGAGKVHHLLMREFERMTECSPSSQPIKGELSQ